VNPKYTGAAYGAGVAEGRVLAGELPAPAMLDLLGIRLLRCEGRVHLGGRTATSEGRIVDAKGKLYGHGTTTCIIVEPPRGTLEP
jgi:hypothetical protein